MERMSFLNNSSSNTTFTGKTLFGIGAFLAAGGDSVYQDINNQIKCAAAPTVDAAIGNCLQGFILPSLQVIIGIGGGCNVFTVQD